MFIFLFIVIIAICKNYLVLFFSREKIEEKRSGVYMKLRVIFIIACIGLVDVYISRRIKHDYEQQQKQATNRQKNVFVAELKHF